MIKKEKELPELGPKLPKVELPKFKPAKLVKKANNKYYKERLRQMRSQLPF